MSKVSTELLSNNFEFAAAAVLVLEAAAVADEAAAAGDLATIAETGSLAISAETGTWAMRADTGVAPICNLLSCLECSASKSKLSYCDAKSSQNI